MLFKCLVFLLLCILLFSIESWNSKVGEKSTTIKTPKMNKAISFVKELYLSRYFASVEVLFVCLWFFIDINATSFVVLLWAIINICRTKAAYLITKLFRQLFMIRLFFFTGFYSCHLFATLICYHSTKLNRNEKASDLRHSSTRSPSKLPNCEPACTCIISNRILLRSLMEKQ